MMCLGRKILMLLILLVLFFGFIFDHSELGWAASEKPIVWTFCDQGPPNALTGRAMTWFANETEKRTNGKVRFNLNWDQSLVKISDAIEAVKVGMLDAATVSAALHEGKTPLLNLLNFPYLAQDEWVALRTAGTLFDEDPALGEELSRWNIQWLGFFCSGTVNIHTKTTPVVSTSDFKGLKLRAATPWEPWVKRWGATPVSIRYSETYDALDKGVIDGLLSLGIASSKAYGFFEKGKYFTLSRMAAPAGYGIAVNKNKWNELSPDLQKIILGIRDEFHDYFGRLHYEENKIIVKWAKETEGVQFLTLTPEETSKWKTVAFELYEPYIEKYESKGLPVRRMINKAKEISEGYASELHLKGYPWERK
jgi:TRAP-type C4-dicarboxylate transport system substrate-binding protein